MYHEYSAQNGKTSRRHDNGICLARSHGSDTTVIQRPSVANVQANEEYYRVLAGIIWGGLPRYYTSQEIKELIALTENLDPKQLAMTLEQVRDLRKQKPECEFEWVLFESHLVE